MVDKNEAKSVGGILQEPAEGDRDMIDRELAREDGGNAENGAGSDKPDETASADLHNRVRTAIDEAAPQTGVRPGP